MEEEKIELIKEYISEEECLSTRGKGLFDCHNCEYLNECYTSAKSEYNNCDYTNHVFADAINFGGYDTEEDFWNELLE